MANKLKAKVGQKGAWIWENWQKHAKGRRPSAEVELELFSDAWFVSDAIHGPFTFVNGVPRTSHDGEYRFKPSVLLRVSHFVDLNQNVLAPDAPGSDYYHGGWVYDEVAALCALILRARIVAGPPTREFNSHSGPYGYINTYDPLLLPFVPLRANPPIIPWLFENRNLSDLSALNELPKLDPVASLALVKAARLFQEALRICDSAPEISWLLLVSAMEVAAGHWSSKTISDTENLRFSYPDLVQLLDEQPNESLTGKVAKKLANLTGATRKFRQFAKTFKAQPPERRPEFGVFDFDDISYDQAINTIYNHRSHALHSGIPFPFPMCNSPDGLSAQSTVPAERPLGLATRTRGATWKAKETPMHLHLFAHIVQQSLMMWWKAMASPET